MHKDEIRVRIVVDCVLNHDKYLCNSNLVQGANEEGVAVHFVSHYCTYSEEYDPLAKLDDREKKRIFECETVQYRKRGTSSILLQPHSM